MITYAIIDKLSKDSAAFDLDKTLFWEELPLQKDGKPAVGTWAVTRGGSARRTPRGLNQKTIIDFYIAQPNKATGEALAETLAEWLRANIGICELKGTLGNQDYHYENIRIWQTSTPQNQGTTPNGVIVKMVSAEVVFDIIK